MQGWEKKGQVKTQCKWKNLHRWQVCISVAKAYCWGSRCPRLPAYNAKDDLLGLTQEGEMKPDFNSSCVSTHVPEALSLESPYSS